MKIITISERYPDDNERVLIFDARWKEWNVGWNAYQHTIGGSSRPGKWMLPEGDADEMHITHWAELPENPG